MSEGLAELRRLWNELVDAVAFEIYDHTWRFLGTFLALYSVAVVLAVVKR